MTSTHLIPFLPPDVERLVFEEAARLCPTKCGCIPILLVARRVYMWIAPQLYEVIIVDDWNSPTTIAILQAIRSNPFLAHAVKTLVISGVMHDDVDMLLKGCTGVIRLGCHLDLDFDVRPELPFEVACQRPTELSVSADTFFGTKYPPGNSPSFKYLTHLEISFRHHFPCSSDLPPQLSHLVLHTPYWDESHLSPIQELLQQCQSLVLVVAVQESFTGYPVPDEIKTCDPRVVVLCDATLRGRWTEAPDIWQLVRQAIHERTLPDLYAGLDPFERMDKEEEDIYR